MRLSEKVLVSLSVIGFILKAFFFEPSGGALLFLSLAALSFIYVIIGWRIFRIELNRSEKQPQFVFSLFSSFALAFGLWAFIYKIFSWHGSGWLLFFALLSFMILLVLFRMQRLDYMAHRYIGMRLTVATIFCFLIFLIPNHTIIRFFYRFDPVLAGLHIKVYDYPEDKQFHMEYQQYKHDLYQRQIREDRNADLNDGNK